MIKSIFIFLLLFYLNKSELLKVITINRHGARAPASSLYNESIFNVPKGDLTDIGKQQLFKVGQYFNQKYVQKLKFLNTSLQETDQLLVFSSEKSRSIESAQALIDGLYDKENPHINFVKKKEFIPYQTNKPREVTIFEAMRKYDYTFHATKLCPRFEKIKAMILDSFVVKSQIKYYKQYLFKKVFPITNKIWHLNYSIENATYKQMTYTFDLINCGLSNKWIEIPELTQDLLDKLEDFKQFQLYVIKNGGKIIPKIANWKITQEIQYLFDQKITELKENTPEEKHKFVVFSGHDTNIIPLAKTFWADEDYYPYIRFADFFIFELHQIDEQYYVQVRFREHSVHLKCSQDLPQLKNACIYSDFVKLLKQSSIGNYFDYCFS